jgi:hypothetical protein
MENVEVILLKKCFVLLWILVLLSLSACSAKTQSLQMFYEDEDINNIDKIVIMDGSSGSVKTITEQEQIDEFLNLINDIEFSPQEDQSKREGWRYSVTLYEGENKFGFTLNQIGEIYYDLNPDIFSIVNEYYKE